MRIVKCVKCNTPFLIVENHARKVCFCLNDTFEEIKFRNKEDLARISDDIYIEG